MLRKFLILNLILLLCFNNGSKAQCEGTLVISRDRLDIDFDNFSKYLSGVSYSGSITLKIEVSQHLPFPPADECTDWKLMMFWDNDLGGAFVPLDGDMPLNVPGQWMNLTPYGVGNNDVVTYDIIKVRVTNISGTSESNTWFLDFLYDDPDRANPNYNDYGKLIYSSNNVPVSYLTNYREYYFIVDIRIDLAHDINENPTNPFRFNPGVWATNLKFVLSEGAP